MFEQKGIANFQSATNLHSLCCKIDFSSAKGAHCDCSVQYDTIFLLSEFTAAKATLDIMLYTFEDSQ